MIWAFSDSHIGGFFNLQKLITFVGMVEKESPMAVVLPGDIFDLYISSWDRIFKDETCKMGYALIRRIGETVPTFYVCGNHDPYSEVAKVDLGHICLLPDTLDFHGIKFLHGHQDQFDPTTKLWKVLTTPIKKYLPSIWSKIFHTPQEMRGRNIGKWEFQTGAIVGKIFNYARKIKQPVVFGHIHDPMAITAPDGTTVACCGDMGGECSYVEISDNGIEIKYI